MLAEFLQGEIFGFFLIFARVGAGIMLLPGFGEAYVSPRIRLLLALTISFAVYPLVAQVVPSLPDSVLALFLLILGEIIIGLFLGAAAKLLLLLLQTAGMMIAHATNLAAAQVFDPSQGTQGTLVGNFLGVMGVALIFVANLHHVMLGALVKSYTVFPAGDAPPLEDFAAFVTRLVSDGFSLAFQLAAPLLVLALIFQVGLGLLARLMPQMHVFFVGMPLQVVLGFAVFAITLAAGMTWYLDRFAQPFATLLGGG